MSSPLAPTESADFERQRRLLEILDEALERPDEEQASFLDDACGGDADLRRDVEALLSTDTDHGLLAAPAFSIHDQDAEIGRHVGGYQIVRLLGRGGMGTIYLAEREDFEQQVALKLIRRGLDVDDVFVRRFHNERQILARLEHPSIARLLDGGTTEDQLPYFVMEHIEGEPLDRYCAARGLSVEERLELFCEVCAAVQYAHQNLVIHRDLKPGNILVTADGTPKLLDFGIAKLLERGAALETVVTVPGEGAMTPRYASPEQIRLEPLTTRSDVYSLGVVLYELLTGLDPYHAGERRDDEVARAVCEEEPERPSTAVRRRSAASRGPQAGDREKLRRRLAGDLDAIVLKAMRKEPSERYSSAERLAEDIRRHLTGLPVQAQTGSFAYRTGKFVRRHRLPLAVALTFVLTITAFTVASVVLWKQAVRGQVQAEKAFDFVQAVLQEADPDDERVDFLNRGRELVTGFDDPEFRIETAGTLGQLFLKLDQEDEAREMMELSLQIAKELYEGDHPEVAKRLMNLAAVLYKQQEYERSEDLYLQALEMKERLDATAQDLLRVRGNLATVRMALGKSDQAEALYRDVLRTRLDLYGPDDKDVATSRRNLAACLFDQGKFEEAEKQLLQALEVRLRVFEPEHTRVASVQDLLGDVLAGQGRDDEAKVFYEQALAVRRQLLGEDHLDVARTMKDLADLLVDEDVRAARELLEPALEVFRRRRPDGRDAADAESVLGSILAAEGRYEEAEPLLVNAYETLKELRGERSWRTRQAHERLAAFQAHKERALRKP